VIYNIPANTTGLPAAVPKNKTLDEAACRARTTLTGSAITDPARRPAIHNSPASEADIAICRVVIVRQLFGRFEQDYGTFISGISISS